MLLLLPRLREPLLLWLERSKAAQLQSAGTGALEAEGSGRGGYPWTPFAVELVFVLVRFAGFFCCVQAFGLSAPSAWTWIASFGLAYAVGLVVPGAPGGLGVFEATLLLRLDGAVAEAPLLAVVLSFRLISTLADVMATGALAVDRALLQWWSSRCR